VYQYVEHSKDAPGWRTTQTQSVNVDLNQHQHKYIEQFNPLLSLVGETRGVYRDRRQVCGQQAIARVSVRLRLKPSVQDRLNESCYRTLVVR
jgi:hypothetical protein